MLTERRRRHIPLRTCIVCQQQRPKREMVRVVRTPEGLIEIDPKGKRAGRGAYVCRSATCWDTALDQRKLARALRMQVTSQDIDSLRAVARLLLEGSPLTSAREGQE
jgi:uncharacterized protein